MARPENKTVLEKEIVELLSSGDKRAISLIFTHYGQALMGIIAKIVQRKDIAEDVFQEVLVKVWRNGKNYDVSKGRLFTWLLNISRNAAIDKTRSKEYKNLLNIRQEARVVDTEQDSPGYQLSTDSIGMAEWVGKLEDKYQEVIDIVYFKGLSHAEAAKALGIPLGTLKTRARTALLELKKLMKD